MKTRRKKLIASLILLVQFFAAKVSIAQTYEPENIPPFQPSIPNYGTPNSDARQGNWNVVSILNAVVAAAVANNPNVDLNTSLTYNSIVGNIGTADTYGPTQNGFYINNLAFESELAKGLTLFGFARNQDDFNRFGDFEVTDGNLKYTIKYTQTIDRTVADAYVPNSGAQDVDPFLGWPPGNFYIDKDIADFPGFNPNQGFYPNIQSYLINDLNYVWDNGFGVFATNRLRDETGSTLYSEEGLQGPIGLNDDMSDTTAGLNYTTPSNDQFYAATTFRNWNNKFQTGSGYIGDPTGAVVPFQDGILFLNPGGPLPTLLYDQPCYVNVPGAGCVGYGVATVPDYKDEDTFWNGTQSGLNIPISKSIYFTGSWQEWNKTTAGTYPSSLFANDGGEDDFPPLSSQALVSAGPNANMGEIPTNLQPVYNVQQYGGKINLFLGPQDAAFVDFGHWDEVPNASVLNETDRYFNHAFAFYRHSFGKQSLSLYGGWQDETDWSTVDFQGTRIWTAFNPLVNNTFSDSLGTAVYNGNTVVFTPNPGVNIPGFVTPVAGINAPPCNAVTGRSGCGTNTITYPVGGVEYVDVAGTVLAYPTVAPLGRESFTANDFLAKVGLSGPITQTLNYDLSMQKFSASDAMFRPDPQDEWKDHFEMNWTPTSGFTVNSTLDIDDNRSNNAVWLYPYSDDDNTFSFTANYMASQNFTLFAGYRNYTQKINFFSPVLNTGSVNFIGPPNANLLPTVGNAADLSLYAPFAQYYALPQDQIGENVADQDQEIQVGLNGNISNDWTTSMSYARTRPQTFQNMFLTNTAAPLIAGSVLTIPNAPAGFLEWLPGMEIMQAVDGRGNKYSFNISRRLHNNARIGLMFQLYQFTNLAPRITAIGVACGAPGTAACPASFQTGFAPYSYGTSLDNGQILSTSLYYTRNF